MKTLTFGILIIIISLFSNTSSAQVSIGINIGVQSAPRYYYLQDIETYYDIESSMYIYMHRGRWIRARVLPSSFGYVDINRRDKVYIRDYHGNKPYSHFRNHRNQYPKNYVHYNGKRYHSESERDEKGMKNIRQSKNNGNAEIRNDNRNNSKGLKSGSNSNNRGQGRIGGGGNGRGNGRGNNSGNRK